METFFRNTPSGIDMAFIVVQHMDPTHKSLLSELLQKHTKMKVCEVQDGMQVEANSVYIIPPNKDMAIFKGRLQLMDPTAPRGQRRPIDYFFRSLALDQKENSIGIIFSGTGTEGTMGLKAIRGEGGLAMVQDPETATYDGMPRSAIAANVMDCVLSPDEMPAQLLKYQKQRHTAPSGKGTPEAVPLNVLDKIFMQVRAQTGHDFSQYKRGTICRRIEKRMAVNQISNIANYLKYLQKEPKEIQALFNAMIIGVTNFFRDKEAFEALKNKILLDILKIKNADERIRVWIPGCSTGEEAYSLAMVIQESLDKRKKRPKVTIFATDLDAQAIETARAGSYTEGINVDVNPERLRRFFDHSGHQYYVKKGIREMMVFATQNLIQDPPFSKLDMICCRNLLIYLNPALQKKIFSIFHYSLLRNGILFLGSSETIGEFSDLFDTVDRKWKIFRKKGIITPSFKMDFHSHPLRVLEDSSRAVNKPTLKKALLSEITEKLLLTEYAPASTVIDESNHALYFYGNTGKYLQPVAGEATLNILDMARPGLKPDLSTAIRKARKYRKQVTIRGVDVDTNGSVLRINLKIKPATDPNIKSELLLIAFEEVKTVENKRSALGAGNPKSHLDGLEKELASTKEYLQATIEEMEASNEKLQTANEELYSANEELQSTNEELETSKEELQSLNEEMLTMNSEMELKIDSLAQTKDDLSNLIASTQVGIVFLDIHLKINGFTPSVTRVIPLIDTDIGRPIEHIASLLINEKLLEDISLVLDTLVPQEKEVRDKDDNWYTLRISPYRTVENVIDGIVITLVNITKQKHNQQTFERVNQHLNLVMEALPAVPFIAAVKRDFTLIFVGESVLSITGFAPKEFISDQNFWVQRIHPKDKKMVFSSLQAASKLKLSQHEFRWKCSNDKYRKFISFVRKVMLPGDDKQMLVGVWQDITALRLSETEQKSAFDAAQKQIAILKSEIK